jgi:hypothetical protein
MQELINPRTISPEGVNIGDENAKKAIYAEVRKYPGTRVFIAVVTNDPATEPAKLAKSLSSLLIRVGVKGGVKGNH